MSNYLAIDAGGAALTVVLKAGGKYHGFTEPQLRRTSAVLLPAVEGLLAEAGIALKDLDYLGVTLGPGSFTGIRVGLVTVKAWAYALGVKCVGVNSLLANAYITKSPCVSLIDGSNGTCYIAVYGADKSEVSPPKCIYAKDVGEAVRGYWGYDVVSDSREITNYKLQITNEVLLSTPALSLPLAVEAAIGRGESGGHDKLISMYIRKSQPERKAGEI